MLQPFDLVFASKSNCEFTEFDEYVLECTRDACVEKNVEPIEVEVAHGIIVHHLEGMHIRKLVDFIPEITFMTYKILDHILYDGDGEDAVDAAVLANLRPVSTVVHHTQLCN